ncbi:MAG: S1 RNA-binding domain-containing protein [Candidatus Promineofilum sp.]|nr:S1 RNA-binding domain-containing protein [Promineifilum sp.]
MSADSIEMTTEETTAAPSAPTSFADLTPKMQLAGTVKRLELYGAFIELGPGLNGLIHVSKLGGEQVNRVSDVLKEGDQVMVWVEKVDPERQQVMLTMVPPLAVDWTDLQTDRPYTGKVTRLETFGAFVNIGAEREGLVHISELSHDYVKHPSEVVKVGDEVEVKVLGFNRRKRRIDLSMKALIEKPTMEMAQSQGQGQYQSPSRSEGRRGGQGGGGNQRRREREQVEVYEPYDEETEEVPTAMEIAMRRALGNDAITAVKSEQRGGRGKKSKQQREDQRRVQDDLLQRTLTLQSDN